MEQQTAVQIFWEETTEKNARILRMFGSSPVVQVPAQIEGRNVTEIGAYCFAIDSHLPKNYQKTILGSDMERTEIAGSYPKQVILPKELKKIGNLAFYNCTSLEQLELGNHTEIVGSDAFMNCRKFHKIILRCGADVKSGLRQILNQMTADLEVAFEREGETEAVVFYPEYYESLDEIAPAHLFHRNIEGEGFRARQCFKDEVVDFTQYDTIFPKACGEESAKTLQKIAVARLCYPYCLGEEARLMYLRYVSFHEVEFMRTWIEERNLDVIEFFCKNHQLTAAGLEQGIGLAAELEWAEGAASLLWLKQKYLKSGTEERYSFDAF